MQKIHDAMNKPGVSAKLKDVLSKVSTYDNVPRKKAKFQVGIISLSLFYFSTLGFNNVFFFFLSLFYKFTELDEKQSQDKQSKSSQWSLGYPRSRWQCKLTWNLNLKLETELVVFKN